MSLGYDANTGDESEDSPPLAAGTVIGFPRPRAATVQVQRSRVRDSWDWIWKDTAQRIVPLAAAGLLAGWLFEKDDALGYSLKGWRREAALGLGVGVPLAAATALFRAWVGPGYRLPTPADQALQTTYYLVVNAPAEELFWRGTVQRVTARRLARIPHLRPAAVPLAWTLATATYALYHRLGNWSWRSIAGVAAAGAIFGALYQSRPRDRALVGVTLAHGLTTAAFLSWGDVFIHQVRLRKVRREVGNLPIQVVDLTQS